MSEINTIPEEPEKQSELEKLNISRLSGKESNQISKECLRIALIHLLSEKEMHQISITELVKRAGVSRATFYRNYDSKDALLDDAVEVMSREFKQIFFIDEMLKNPYPQYLKLFQLIQDNQTTLRSLLMAKVSFGDVLKIFPLSEKPDSAQDTESYYKRLVFEGAILSITTEWFISGMQQSCEEMASLCTKIIRF